MGDAAAPEQPTADRANLPAVTVTFAFTKDELRHAARLFWKFWPTRWKVGAITVTALSVPVFILLPRLGRLFPEPATWVSALAVTLLAALVAVHAVRSVATIRRIRAEREAPARAEERTISEGGLDVAGAQAVEFLPWSRITRVVETAQFFVFVRSEDLPHVVPKRALTPAQQHQVRALIARHAPRAALPPAPAARAT